MLRFVFKNRNQALSALLFLPIVLFISSCSKSTVEESDHRGVYYVPDSVMKTLAISECQLAPLTSSIKFNGMVDVDPDMVLNVYPLISGNVQGASPMLGDYVHKGESLGIVRSAEIAGYDATLVNAQENVRLNLSLLNRAKDMAKGGLASQVDVTQAEVAYQQALAAKIQAEKVLAINGSGQNGTYSIKAPIDGFIVQKNITDGMSIRPDNNNPLYVISDLKTVWVQANVYEANIGKVHLGDAADVTTITYPDKVFHGKVDKLMNVLDPSNRVMKMRVVLSNPDYLLKPQMFATVTVNNSLNQQVRAIPSSALVFDNSQYYVIVYKSNKDVKLRNVQLISNNGVTAFIKDGLEVGEKVISSNAILIYGELNS
ncbi:MAG: efflux RND transporter periplasmic adaptor subunit [Bacteroidetes bacterium]|nr:efflux RND transporter periplasmic adaptor subunit [Bacteroidota bacterium]MBS1741116.1 efflux RND transporter periplasmic adaptor subunit [Bacteroidota bacterium]MBS1774999.1 efflux RND transporter periplasmic adaptor subunit [Bacteroidota bacterium]